MDSHAVDVDEGIAGGKLLDGCFLIGQTIVAEIAVAVVVIPFRTVGMSAAVADGDHYESGLCETVGAHRHAGERIVGGLDLRARIYIVDDGIGLLGIEIKRLVHDSVEIGHSVGCLDSEHFGELVAVGEQLAEIGALQCHDFISAGVVESCLRYGVDAGEVIDEIAGVIIHYR